METLCHQQNKSVAETVHRGVIYGLHMGLKAGQSCKEVRVISFSNKNEVHIIFITYVLELY